MVNEAAASGLPYTAIISIQDPARKTQRWNYREKWQKQLDERCATNLCLYFWDTEDPDDRQGPSERTIAKIVGFCTQHIDRESRVLIHCMQGISRSSAAAVILLLATGQFDDARLAAQFLRAAKPDIDPNERMLELYALSQNKEAAE